GAVKKVRTTATPRPRAARTLRAVTPDLLADVGRRVRAAREARAESRAGLAARSGISLRFLAQLEAGSANISLLRLNEVAQALGADLRAFLSGPDIAPAAAVSAASRRTIDELLAGRSAAELRAVEHWLTERFATRSVVALLGLRGAGKSTVGLQLARA